MDGCPVVHLSDGPEDLAHVLRVLFWGSLNYLKTEGKIPFSAMAAFIRLGHKYEMSTLRDSALDQLEETLCGECPNFDCLPQFLKRLPFTLTCRDGITLVNLARLTDRKRLLPFAFYTCVHLSAETILGEKGHTRAAFSRRCATLSPWREEIGYR